MQFFMNLIAMLMTRMELKMSSTPPRETLVIRQNRSYCGNCGNSGSSLLSKSHCDKCKTAWRYIASNHRISGETVAQMGKRLIDESPRPLPFIGTVVLDFDGIGDYSERCYIAVHQ